MFVIKWFWLCGIFWASRASVIPVTDTNLPPTCDSYIYCQGDLLNTIQLARLYEDSKYFVDMSLIHSPEETLMKYNQMMQATDNNPTREQLQSFVDQCFLHEGELDEWIPEDFTENPSFLSKIVDKNVTEFAKEIISIWKSLGRKVKKEVETNPEKHSLIYVPNGFIIPGGRFREYYYWDSYWIIEGLLINEMPITAKGMIDNFIRIVAKYGFVPNGGRVYYLQRSQPPMLTLMAKKYYDATKYKVWLKNNIQYLDQEVTFWLNHKMKKVNVNGMEYDLGYYIAESRGPRPESYYEDVTIGDYYKDADAKQKFYNELKAAAQSGWDFSSRWIFDENGGIDANLTSINSTRVAPVDLNAFLYGAFNTLAKFYKILGNQVKQNYWDKKAESMLDTINEVFWDEEDGMWYDFDIESKKPRKYFAASHLTPLWVSAYNKDNHKKAKQITQVVKYLEKHSITDYQGGIPATLEYTQEQWDFPNAWPPLQSIVVQGLEKSGDPDAKRLARKFAEQWVEANMMGYKRTGAMFEKYDAMNKGHYGGGGEYRVQKGFGWTNGVVLDFIKTYYTVEK